MIYYIVLLTLAGPLIGAVIGVMKKYSKKQVYMMLAFAAGVMIAISVFQLAPNSLRSGNFLILVSGAIIGGLLMWVLNFIIPHYHHHDHESKLKKAAFFLFVGIFIHNFPEGMAIGAGGLQSINFSLLVALAIAIHDIPETLCVSAPLANSLKNRHKAFWMAMLSAVPTIFGFFVSYYYFQDLPKSVFAFITSITAGIMVYISFVEILSPIYYAKIQKLLIGSCFVFGVIFVLFLQQIIK